MRLVCNLFVLRKVLIDFDEKRSKMNQDEDHIKRSLVIALIRIVKTVNINVNASTTEVEKGGAAIHIATNPSSRCYDWKVNEIELVKTVETLPGRYQYWSAMIYPCAASVIYVPSSSVSYKTANGLEDHIAVWFEHGGGREAVYKVLDPPLEQKEEERSSKRQKTSVDGSYAIVPDPRLLLPDLIKIVCDYLI
jgi:hypothetical protein